MTDGQAALLRLMAWLSPAFPVGSFSYSHGLETAVHRGLVHDAATLKDWLADLVERGSAWNDAVLFAEGHRRTRSFSTVGQRDAQRHDPPPLACRPSPPQGGRSAVLNGSRNTNTAEEGEVATLRISPLEGEMSDRTEGGNASQATVSELVELGEAMAGSRERHMETMLQGAAFVKAASAWPAPALSALPETCPYPVAVGTAAGAHGVALDAALAAFLHAFVSNQLQAAIRLSVLGQTDAMATLAALEPLIGQTATRATISSLDDLGSATMMAEISAMQHETHYSRLFRT